MVLILVFFSFPLLIIGGIFLLTRRNRQTKLSRPDPALPGTPPPTTPTQPTPSHEAAPRARPPASSTPDEPSPGAEHPGQDSNPSASSQ